MFVEKNNINAFRIRKMDRDGYSIFLVTYDPIRIQKSIFKRSVFRILDRLSEEEADYVFTKINRVLGINS